MREKTGKRFMVYLNPEVRETSGRIAKARYGIAWSKLVELLLRKELSLKRGMVHRPKSFLPASGLPAETIAHEANA